MCVPAIEVCPFCFLPLSPARVSVRAGRHWNAVESMFNLESEKEVMKGD